MDEQMKTIEEIAASSGTSIEEVSKRIESMRFPDPTQEEIENVRKAQKAAMLNMRCMITEQQFRMRRHMGVK